MVGSSQLMKGKNMDFNMNYETELPIEFCGRIVSYVSCVAELECDTSEGSASYKIINIRLTDYNGDYYEPSGEDFEMVSRMLRKHADKHICECIWDKDDWEGSVIRGNKDGGIYA